MNNKLIEVCVYWIVCAVVLFGLDPPTRPVPYISLSSLSAIKEMCQIQNSFPIKTFKILNILFYWKKKALAGDS